MLVQFQDRSGSVEEVEMDTDEPCPICCGMVFLIDESDAERGYRCSSCSILFEPVDEDSDVNSLEAQGN